MIRGHDFAGAAKLHVRRNAVGAARNGLFPGEPRVLRRGQVEKGRGEAVRGPARLPQVLHRKRVKVVQMGNKLNKANNRIVSGNSAFNLAVSVVKIKSRTRSNVGAGTCAD